MKLYHYSNGLYKKLKDFSEKKSGIWFTTSADGYNGQSWLFRYDIDKNEFDLKLNERIFESNTSKIRWFTYNEDEMEYDSVICLNQEFAPLVDAIIEFRSMIEHTDFSVMPIASNFLRFPKGCCGDTSVLLWKYLQIKFNGRFDRYIKYKCGIKKQSHAWLEYQDGIIIDITADQFSDINEPVVITTDNRYYNVFKKRSEQEEVSDFYKFEKNCKERLIKIYNLITDGSD